MCFFVCPQANTFKLINSDGSESFMDPDFFFLSCLQYWKDSNICTLIYILYY